MHINYIFLMAVPMEQVSQVSLLYAESTAHRHVVQQAINVIARLPPVQRCSTTHVNSHSSIFTGNRNSAKSALSWHASGGLSALLNLVS
jgi:hypothetical protein